MLHVVFQFRPSLPIVTSLLVTLGLIAVPVECTVAAGPHSIFLPPEAVAVLQEGEAPNGHAHHGRARNEFGVASASLAGDPHAGMHHAGSGSNPESDREDQPVPPKASPNSRPGAMTASPPRPAGFAGDAVVAVSLPAGAEAPLEPGLPAKLPTDVSPPAEHLLPGPETPPP